MDKTIVYNYCLKHIMHELELSKLNKTVNFFRNLHELELFQT